MTASVVFFGALSMMGCVLKAGGGESGGDTRADDASTDAGSPSADPVARVESGLVALYRFDEGEGQIIHDSSSAESPLDLVIEVPGAVVWTSTGLRVDSSGLIASPGNATKIVDACVTSGELTVEAWIRPTASAAGSSTLPERIATLSGSIVDRDFTLGFGSGNLATPAPRDVFSLRVRTTETDPNGIPALDTPTGTTATALVHVIAIANGSADAVIYLDAEEVARGPLLGDFSNWSLYRLALGDEIGGVRTFLGEYQLVAVYCRALGAQEVEQNFAAGP